MSGALTPRQRTAALALAFGASGVDAAAAAGVSDRTLRRWRDLPDFELAIEDGTDALLADHRLGAAALVRDSVARLRDRLADPLAPAGARDRIAAGIVRDAALAAFALGGGRAGEARLDVAMPDRVLPPVLVIEREPDPE